MEGEEIEEMNHFSSKMSLSFQIIRAPLHLPGDEGLAQQRSLPNRHLKLEKRKRKKKKIHLLPRQSFL